MDDLHNQLIQLVQAYQMPDAALELLKQHPPKIVAGTTASGKDAVDAFIQENSNWQHVVTTTTRPAREGEVDGKDYWFVSEEQMLQRVKDQAFIEVVWFAQQQVSGSSIEAYKNVLQAGQQPILRIDMQGIETILKKGVDVRPFFILPPSFEIWMERLDKRGHMSHTDRVKRLRTASQEMEVAIQNDKFMFVINDEINRVSKEILQGATDGMHQRERRELAQRLIDYIKAY